VGVLKLSSQEFVAPKKQTSIKGLVKTVTDKKNAYSLDSVIALKNKSWSTQRNNLLNFGMITYPIWCKIEIENKRENRYLKLSNPLIDEVDFFLVDTTNTVVIQKKSGAAFPFNIRDIHVFNHIFKIPKGKYTCYIRFKSNFHLQVLIEENGIESLLEKQHDMDIGLALYLGLMIVMVIYNLFLYFSIKDITYLYYVGYVFFVTLTYASFKGVSFEYLWPNTPYFNFLIPSISSTATIFTVLFVRSLLNTKKNVPNLTKGLYLIIIGLLIAIFINGIGNYFVGAIISQILTLLLSFYLIVIGVVCFRKRVYTAKYFLFAWTLFLISVIVYILMLNGVIAYNIYTENSILCGSAIETVLLSFVLANKINILRKEKQTLLESQSKMLKIEFGKAKKIIEENENHKKIIADQLENSVIQKLSVAKLMLSSKDALSIKTQKVLEEGMNDVKNISREIFSFTLERFGLLASIENLLMESPTISFGFDMDFPELNINTERHIYRVIEYFQGLNNVHEIFFSLKNKNSTLVILIEKKGDKTFKIKNEIYEKIIIYKGEVLYKNFGEDMLLEISYKIT
jgi:signal transduction histidine kinase